METAKNATQQTVEYALRQQERDQRAKAQREYLAAFQLLRRKYGAQLATETVVGHVGAMMRESDPGHWLVRDCRKYLIRCLLKGWFSKGLTARLHFH